MRWPMTPLEARWYDPASWGAPFGVVVAALWGIVLLRAGATYALGRAAGHGLRARSGRLERWRRGAGFRRAEALVERWGAPVVAASFLTIGLQTAINLAAGVLRMPLRLYLPALLVGGLAWALVYASVGLVSLGALAHLHERSPIAAWSVGLLLLSALAAYLVVTWRRSGRRPDRADSL